MPTCSRCTCRPALPTGKLCERCLAHSRARPKAPPKLPPPPPSGTRLLPPASALANHLTALAAEAEEIGLRGSAQRLREHAAELRADPSADRVREVGRLVAEACVRARAEEGDDGRAVYLLWRRALPVGAKVPVAGGRVA